MHRDSMQQWTLWDEVAADLTKTLTLALQLEARLQTCHTIMHSAMSTASSYQLRSRPLDMMHFVKRNSSHVKSEVSASVLSLWPGLCLTVVDSVQKN